MRKLRHFVLIMLSLIGMTTFGQGINNPLLINNLDDLNAFRDAVNFGSSYQGVSGMAGFRDVYFKLTADIDMGNVNWQPIGTPISNFYGNFDGDNHVISNLRLYYPNDDDIGFFRFCFDATIENIHFQGGTICGKNDVGTVCANNYDAVVRNCTSTADVTGIEKVGQLVGSSMGGEISNCSNETDITGQTTVGGIVGSSMFTTIFSCTNTGIVSAESTVGGICGMNSVSQETGGVSDCFNYGNVYATMDQWDYSKAGGICGYLQSGFIRNCANYGNVIAHGDCVGGICGFSFDLIEKCINIGDVKGGMNVFGIGKAEEVIGCMNSGMVCGNNSFVSGISDANYIHACINVGDVYGGNDTGGIICSNLSDENRYYDCINAGNVFSFMVYVGGIIGMNNANSVTVSNCFWDKQMCELKGGIGPHGNPIQEGTYARFTDELTGFALQSFLNPDEWVFTDGLYPYPAGLIDPEAARLAASPMFLSYIDDSNYEVSQVILSDFDITVLDGIQWHSTTGKVSISDNHVSLLENGYDTIYLTNNQSAIKKLPIVINPGGTIENPLTISNEDELIDFSNAVNNFTSGYYKGLKNKNDGFSGKYFVLNNDLDMNNRDINPIGRFNFPFRGYFNGNNHVINNLYINRDYEHVGLFGSLEYALVENINLLNLNILGESWIGSISGHADESVIRNCHCYGTVKGNNNFTGGICGQIYQESIISDCSFAGIVEGYRYAGGITAGSSQSYVKRCTNIAIVNGGISVGGVVGLSNGIDSISNCFNAGTVFATENNAGGICGINYWGHYSSNVNIGAVYCDKRAGGIIGSDTLADYHDNFYDNQICIKGGISGNDISGKAEGMNTEELIGEGLASILGNELWNYESDLYPCLSNIYNEDLGIVARTPIYLQNQETLIDVNTDFTVGTKNDVSWNSSNQDVITIDGDAANVLISGESILSATRNNVSRSVKVYAKGFYNIEDQDNTNNISIYPNPAHNQLNINAEGLKIVRIFNISGQIVYETNENSIDVSEFGNGIYLVEIETNSDIILKRVVVSK